MYQFRASSVILTHLQPAWLLSGKNGWLTNPLSNFFTRALMSLLFPREERKHLRTSTDPRHKWELAGSSLPGFDLIPCAFQSLCQPSSCAPLCSAPREKGERLDRTSGGGPLGSSSCPLWRTPPVAAASALEGSCVWACRILILESGSSPSSAASKHFHGGDATTPISSSYRTNLYSGRGAWRPLKEDALDIRLGVLCVALPERLWLVSMLLIQV